MRPLLVAAALLAAAAPASAQMTGMCSFANPQGMPYSVSGTFGLAIKDLNNGTFTNVATAQTNSVVGLADCVCNAQDLFVTAKLMTNIPVGTVQPYEVWEGASCNISTNRINGSTLCGPVEATTDPTEFALGGSQPYQKIDVPTMVSPGAPSCPQGGTSASSQLWFLFNPSQPTADYCTLPVTVDTLLPEAPVVTAGPGDSAVGLSWNKPQVGSTQPIGWQVLCADLAGNPVAGVSGTVANNQIAYSTCTRQMELQRRGNISTGGTANGTDGGVTSGADLGTASEPLGGGGAGGGLGTSADPVDGGATNPFATYPLNGLDHKYVCSPIIRNPTLSTRIGNLQNGTTYQFVVVAFDGSGNPSPSQLIQATPQPVEDLYRRFRDEGGQPQGFCAIGARGGWSILIGLFAAAALLVARRKERP